MREGQTDGRVTHICDEKWRGREERGVVERERRETGSGEGEKR
jgi:ribosomal protein L15E